MSPTVKRKLQGLLALAAALVVAGAGCTEPMEDDDDDLGSAALELAPVDSEGPMDMEDDEIAGDDGDPGSPSSPGATKLGEVSGPEPIPWIPTVPEPEEECGTPANPSPMTHGSGSNGGGGK